MNRFYSPRRVFSRMKSYLPSLFGCLIFFLALSQAQQARDPVQILLQMQTPIRACYSLDGRGNNIENPSWGAVNEPLLRVEGDAYVDGDWNQPPVEGRPNSRRVSNAISHETCADADRSPEVCLNDWFWLWGQMIDHDMVLSPTIPKSDPRGHMDIISPQDDVFFRGRRIPFTRGLQDINDPRQQINLATAFLDASQVYGTDAATARAVRTMVGGFLQSTADGFMPILSARLGLNHSSTPTFTELGSPHGRDQFLCADMRCNQHAPMAAMQAMIIREHNRIARAIGQARHPAYRTDEQIYQAARALVIAMLQAITYEEFLPLALGRFNLPRYSGYNPSLRPSILNSFATAAFRVSHSMIGCNFRETTATGQVLRSINFASAFFDSTWIRGLPAQPNRANRETNAYQTIMHGLGSNPSARMDSRVAPSLRSVIFAARETPLGPVPEVAFDVVAADIERGRDHGLLSYTEMRRNMGWSEVRSIADITTNEAIIRALEPLYPDVEKLDLFVGLMIEDPLDGALFGPVTTSILRDQFERLRSGDRCWYENRFSGQLLEAIRNTRLKDLVDRNFEATPANTPFSADGSPITSDADLGLDGATIEPVPSSRGASTLRHQPVPGGATGAQSEYAPLEDNVRTSPSSPLGFRVFDDDSFEHEMDDISIGVRLAEEERALREDARRERERRRGLPRRRSRRAGPDDFDDPDREERPPRALTPEEEEERRAREERRRRFLEEEMERRRRRAEEMERMRERRRRFEEERRRRIEEERRRRGTGNDNLLVDGPLVGPGSNSSLDLDLDDDDLNALARRLSPSDPLLNVTAMNLNVPENGIRLLPSKAGQDVVAFRCSMSGCIGLSYDEKGIKMQTASRPQSRPAVFGVPTMSPQQQQRMRHLLFMNRNAWYRPGHVMSQRNPGQVTVQPGPNGQITASGRMFGTMQFGAGGFPFNNLNNNGFLGPVNANPGTTPNRPTTGPARRVLQPAPGITQTAQRPPLASVSPNVLRENIFLMSACRR